nr:hypothetical protein [Corynebacterium mycetoides]
MLSMYGALAIMTGTTYSKWRPNLDTPAPIQTRTMIIFTPMM